MLRVRCVDRLERAGGRAGWMGGWSWENAPLTWCFGTVELLWGWYRKPVLFGAEEGGVPPWRERMTQQKDTFWLTVSQPVCPALSGVNMEGWTGGNGYEECLGVALLWETSAYNKVAKSSFSKSSYAKWKRFGIQEAHQASVCTLLVSWA